MRARLVCLGSRRVLVVHVLYMYQCTRAVVGWQEPPPLLSSCRNCAGWLTLDTVWAPIILGGGGRSEDQVHHFSFGFFSARATTTCFSPPLFFFFPVNFLLQDSPMTSSRNATLCWFRNKKRGKIGHVRLKYSVVIRRPKKDRKSSFFRWHTFVCNRFCGFGNSIQYRTKSKVMKWGLSRLC